jgi:EAL domain-containing protein (putative c-di-GMP-specific phosphodiesterase class I)
MVKAITQVSNELGVKVIAEFVHSKEVLEILKSFNIEQFQGYYFYEPSLELIEEKNTI